MKPTVDQFFVTCMFLASVGVTYLGWWLMKEAHVDQLQSAVGLVICVVGGIMTAAWVAMFVHVCRR